MTIHFDCSTLEHSLKQLVATLNPDDAAQGLVPVNAIHVFDSVPSTNQAAWELLQQGAGAGTVVIALQQTAGRGQRGHQWHSAQGGLYLSMTFAPELAAASGTDLTLSSAWGVASALRQQHVAVDIKWLNDLVIDGRKLGGILTETRISQQRIRQAVIGVGINWQNPVPAPGVNLQTVLAGQATPLCSLETLAATVIYGLVKGDAYYRSRGINALLDQYHRLMANLGQVRTVNGVAGTIIGVTAEAALRIQPLADAATEMAVLPGEFSLGYG